MPDENDWKKAYEAALIREDKWRTEAISSRRKLRRIREYAITLRQSHPSRLEHAKAVGNELWERSL